MKLIEERVIDTNAADAWAMLAENFGLAEKYANEFATSSKLLTAAQPRGIGARYRMYMKHGYEIDEEVVGWEEGRSITLETIRTKNLPLTSMTRTLGVLPFIGEERCTIYIHVEFEPSALRNKIEAFLMARPLYSLQVQRTLKNFDRKNAMNKQIMVGRPKQLLDGSIVAAC